jgi:hypothetical protein
LHLRRAATDDPGKKPAETSSCRDPHDYLAVERMDM